MSKEDPSESKWRIQCGILVIWAGVVEEVERGNRIRGIWMVQPSPQRGRAFFRHTPMKVKVPLLLLM